MRFQTTQRRAIAACLFEVGSEAGAQIQIFPAGVFRARDGRPAGLDGWQLDETGALRLIAQIGQRQTPVVVDYEHQTLLSEVNGQPAPAAGWIDPTALTWKPGKGLYAEVRWTERASAMIAAGEYRYISPVFHFDPKTGAVLELLHVALTNNPALDGMDAVAARFDHAQQETPMEELMKLFGLAVDATEDQAVAALKALQQQVAELTAKTSEQEAAIAAAKAETPQTAVAAMQQMQAELAALRQQVEGKEVDDLVTAALSAGKLVPVQEQWARDLGKSNLAALKTYIETAQPIAALSGQQSQDRRLDNEGDPQLSDEELAVCRQMGVSVDDYLKTLKEAH